MRHRVITTLPAVAALGLSAALLTGGCDAADAPRTGDPAADTAAVAPPVGEAPAPAPAATPAAALRAALVQRLQGPTAAERATGQATWFSAATADALRSVDVDSAGRAVVDFRDLRPIIPNASSSAGSEMLLQQLNDAVFRIPEVRSVEYRMEGSCDLFWQWLQRGCETVTRHRR